MTLSGNVRRGAQGPDKGKEHTEQQRPLGLGLRKSSARHFPSLSSTWGHSGMGAREWVGGQKPEVESVR